MNWLKIIARKRLGLCSGIPEAIAECDELIAISVSSTRTAGENADWNIKNQNSTVINRQSYRGEFGFARLYFSASLH